jgi:hypothetical protein
VTELEALHPKRGSRTLNRSSLPTARRPTHDQQLRSPPPIRVPRLQQLRISVLVVLVAERGIRGQVALLPPLLEEQPDPQPDLGGQPALRHLFDAGRRVQPAEDRPGGHRAGQEPADRAGLPVRPAAPGDLLQACLQAAYELRLEQGGQVDLLVSLRYLLLGLGRRQRRLLFLAQLLQHARDGALQGLGSLLRATLGCRLHQYYNLVG